MVKVMSSYCSFVLNRRTSSTMAAISPSAGRCRWRRNDSSQTLLAEFLARFVERFGDSIGIDCQGIAWAETTLANLAIPAAEQPAAQYW